MDVDDGGFISCRSQYLSCRSEQGAITINMLTIMLILEGRLNPYVSTEETTLVNVSIVDSETAVVVPEGLHGPALPFDHHAPAYSRLDLHRFERQQRACAR